MLNTAGKSREGGRSQEFSFFCFVVLDKPSTPLALSCLVFEMIITSLIIYLLAWGWVTSAKPLGVDDHSSSHPAIHSSIPSTSHHFIQPPPFIDPHSHPSLHPCFHPFFSTYQSSTHPSVHSSVHSPIHPSTHLFFPSSIYSTFPTQHSPTHSSVHLQSFSPSLHIPIHSFMSNRLLSCSGNGS